MNSWRLISWIYDVETFIFKKYCDLLSLLKLDLFAALQIRLPSSLYQIEKTAARKNYDTIQKYTVK